MIIIDNYDSFTYNIVQYFMELGCQPRVFKNDDVTIEDLDSLDFSTLIISPGPSNPDNSGISINAIKHFYKTKKILGICLGHQCIAQLFGSKIVRAKEPVHGKVSKVYFNSGEPLFSACSQGFDATRYHSLVVDSICDDSPISVIAKTGDDVIMALKHNEYKVYGVQFHPEAILTKCGKTILKNFLQL